MDTDIWKVIAGCISVGLIYYAFLPDNENKAQNIIDDGYICIALTDDNCLCEKTRYYNNGGVGFAFTEQCKNIPKEWIYG